MIKNGRKVDFKPVHQTFIELVETTANVDHILGVVQRKWGTNFVLVTQDGLKLEDAPGTQGIYACMPHAVSHCTASYILCKCTQLYKCIDIDACICMCVYDHDVLNFINYNYVYRANILEKST